MNHLHIGTEGLLDWLLAVTKPRFILIDDGPIADAFLARFPKARLFDPAAHSFNPLQGIDYKRARDFAETLYSASPGGSSTLTVRNGRRALVRLLLAGSKRLSDLPGPRETKDDAEQEALGMVEELLLSPVLKKVLCSTPNFRLGEGTTVARLDRAKLGDFDAFVLASLLIGQHKGQVIVPDFGFYGRPLHLSLMRQDRLTAGVRYLDEVDDRKLRQALLTIPDKIGAGCTFDDATVLANYDSGYRPDQDGFKTFVERAMEHAGQSLV